MEDETVIFYADPLPNGRPDANKPLYKMQENEYINDFRNIGMNDWTSGIYVHPRMHVDFWKDMSKGGQAGWAEGRSDGGPVKDIYWMKRYNFNDVISSAQARPLMSKQDWVQKCCRHETSDMVSQEVCGRYWGQNPSDCGNLGCTGESLKTDPVCQDWCIKNPRECDSLKLQWCRDHPGDNYCGCINDTEKARTERAAYPSIVADRVCWPGSDCQKTDLQQTFITSELANRVCPSDLNTQIVNFKNTGTMINSDINSSITTKKTTVPSNPSNPSNPSMFSGMWIWIIFLILILILAVSAVFLLFSN